MATKSKKKTAARSKDDLVRVAMNLAAERAWADLTLRDIAQAADMSLVDLHEVFEDKTDVLVALGRMIDRQVLENMGDIDPMASDLSERDMLFDILMERFDILNEYRAGIVSVLGSFLPDPKQAIISMPYLCKSMSWMLEAAGVDTTGISGALKVTGLCGVYLNVLRIWKDDEGVDMPKTMAALDKDLGRGEKVLNMFGF